MWNQAVVHWHHMEQQQSIDKSNTFHIRFSDFSQCIHILPHCKGVEHVSKQLPVYTSSSQAATWVFSETLGHLHSQLCESSLWVRHLMWISLSWSRQHQLADEQSSVNTSCWSISPTLSIIKAHVTQHHLGSTGLLTMLPDNQESKLSLFS